VRSEISGDLCTDTLTGTRDENDTATQVQQVFHLSATPRKLAETSGAAWIHAHPDMPSPMSQSLSPDRRQTTTPQ
jgi:hypothetical protein